jgi:signal transduction histidine kinase/ActR/RegA family two-component response regulator
MTRTRGPAPRVRVALQLGALALLAGIVVGGVLRARHLRRNAFTSLARALPSNGRQAAATVGYWLFERRADAAVAARSVFELAAAQDHPGLFGSHGHITRTFEDVRAFYGYEGAWIIDTAGAAVVRSGPSGLEPMAAELTAARVAARSGRSEMVGPFRDAEGRVSLSFVAPIVQVPAPALGALILRIDLNATLLHRLPVRLAGSESGQSRLVGRVGDEFVVISASVYPEAPPFTVRLPWSEAHLAGRHASTGTDTVGIFVDGEGQRVLAATSHVSGTSWGIVRSIGEEEVLAGYRQQVQGELRAALLLTLLIAVLAAIVRRSIMARSERDSAASRSLLAAAQSLGRMGSWTWDPDAPRMTWTPELYRILGHEPEAVTPSLEALREAATPDDLPALEAALGALMTEQAPFDLEYGVRQPDGGLRYVQATCRSVPRPGAAGNGSPIYLGVLADITDRRELEAKLVQAQKMQAVGQLAGGIAHDFNNMMTVVIGSCDLLADEVAGNAIAMAEVQELRRVGERAAALTTQLLAFSSQQVVRTEVLDLDATVAQAESLIRRVLRTDIELRRVPSSRPAYVRADPVQLQQVLLNLALNARDAMPGGGTLTFTTAVRRGAGGTVTLTARDTGTGIAEDLLARIFEPFFTTKERGKGTGLGLPTAQGIIAQFGGELTVESTVGEGSSFTIVLPRVAAAAVAIAPAPREPQQLDGRETILLVEDDPAVRRGTRRILQHYGYHVLEACDGVQGVRLASTFDGTIDLLLTDAMMPNMAGGQAARQILSVRPEIKVLLMSGYTDDAALRSGLSDRRYPFLQKPFDRNELAVAVRNTLEPGS